MLDGDVYASATARANDAQNYVVGHDELHQERLPTLVSTLGTEHLSINDHISSFQPGVSIGSGTTRDTSL